MQRGGACVGESLGASVSMGCSRPLSLQVHKRARSYMFSAMDAQSESPRLDMRRGGGCMGESFGASVSIGCFRPFDLQVHRRARSYRYGCSLRIAQIRHAARGRLRGGQLRCQRLNRLLRHRQVPRHNRAQAPLLLQCKVRAVKTFAPAPLHSTARRQETAA